MLFCNRIDLEKILQLIALSLTIETTVFSGTLPRFNEASSKTNAYIYRLSQLVPVYQPPKPQKAIPRRIEVIPFTSYKRTKHRNKTIIKCIEQLCLEE